MFHHGVENNFVCRVGGMFAFIRVLLMVQEFTATISNVPTRTRMYVEILKP